MAGDTPAMRASSPAARRGPPAARRASPRAPARRSGAPPRPGQPRPCHLRSWSTTVRGHRRSAPKRPGSTRPRMTRYLDDSPTAPTITGYRRIGPQHDHARARSRWRCWRWPGPGCAGTGRRCTPTATVAAQGPGRGLADQPLDEPPRRDRSRAVSPDRWHGGGSPWTRTSPVHRGRPGRGHEPVRGWPCTPRGLAALSRGARQADGRARASHQSPVTRRGTCAPATSTSRGVPRGCSTNPARARPGSPRCSAAPTWPCSTWRPRSPRAAHRSRSSSCSAPRPGVRGGRAAGWTWCRWRTTTRWTTGARGWPTPSRTPEPPGCPSWRRSRHGRGVRAVLHHHARPARSPYSR